MDEIQTRLMVEAVPRGFENVDSAIKRLSSEEDKLLTKDKQYMSMRSRMIQVQDRVNSQLSLSAQREQAMGDAMQQASERVAAGMALQEQRYNALQASLQTVIDFSYKAATAFGAIAAAGVGILAATVPLAARVETLGVVIDTVGKNAGYTTEYLDGLETSLTKQGITLQATRQSMARMVESELDLADATDLARMAQDAAVISGDNSSEAFDRLVQVVAGGNVLMARHMGIMVNFQQAYDEYAKSIGKSADELTAQEKVQVRMNKVLNKGQLIAGAYSAAMDTAGKKVTSLARHVEESRRVIGEMFVNQYADAIDAATALLEKIEKMPEAERQQVASTIEAVTAISSLSAGMFILIGMYNKARSAYLAWQTAITAGTAISVGAFAMLTAAVVAWAGALYLGLKIARQIADQNKQLAAATEDHAHKVMLSNVSYSDYRAELERVAKLQGLMIDEAGNLVRKHEAMGAVNYELVQSNYLLSESARQAAKEARNLSVVEGAAMTQAFRTADAMSYLSKGQQEYRSATQDAIEAMYEQDDALNTFRDKVVITTGEMGRAIQAGLAAGLKGEMTQTWDNYATQMEQLGEEEANLTAELEKAQKQGWSPTSKKVQDLTSDLEANRKKQLEASDAVHEMTKSMLYQQAAANLSAGAALELARNMGLISEEDFNAAEAVQLLREQYDKNHDETITASEVRSNTPRTLGRSLQ